MANKVIGIDVGHCETAAACPHKNGDKNEVQALVVNDGNGNVGLSQIILTFSQMQALKGHKYPDFALLKKIAPFRIGELPSYVPDGERFFYFKVAPKDFHKPCGNTPTAKSCGITHGMVMACYIYAAVDNIIKYNPGDLTEADRAHTRLLIGCPTTSDWTSTKEKNEYAKLAKIATGVESVEIIPESRAAMFSSVGGGVTNISAADGAAVFDFGSSTADCTYMLLGRKILEFSWALGASEVERQMTREALEGAIQLNGPFTPDIAMLADNDAELRALKQKYYDKLLPPKGYPFVCSFSEDVDHLVKIHKNFMDKVTGQRKFQINCDSVTLRDGSWQDHCRAFYQEAKKRISQAFYNVYKADGSLEKRQCTLNTIVLTGGASKMDFIEEICREVFPEKNIKIVRNVINPSHTVSNGLGWVSIADENLESCKAAAKKELLSVHQNTPKALADAISDELFQLLSSIAVELTKRWADAPGDEMTIETLQQWLDNATKDPKVMQKMETICETRLNAWKKTLSSGMEKAVNAQTQMLYSANVSQNLILPSDIWQSLSTQSMNLNQMDMHSLLKKIDFGNLANQIAKFIVKAVIWVAGAMLAPETFGISLLVAWVATMFTDEALSDRDLKRPRRRAQRQNLAGRIRGELANSKGEIMKSFNEAFASQTSSFEAVVDSSLDIAFKIVTLQRFEL